MEAETDPAKSRYPGSAGRENASYCAECDTSFPNEEALRRHQNVAHPQGSSGDDRPRAPEARSPGTRPRPDADRTGSGTGDPRGRNAPERARPPAGHAGEPRGQREDETPEWERNRQAGGPAGRTGPGTPDRPPASPRQDGQPPFEARRTETPDPKASGSTNPDESSAMELRPGPERSAGEDTDEAASEGADGERSQNEGKRARGREPEASPASKSS
jgi:hypothetical protein